MSKAKFAKCEECSLLKNKFVPSEFNSNKLAFIAEAPGLTETIQGKPLVGAAGKELMNILSLLGYKREDFSYLNACCCRPVDIVDGKEYNRTPTVSEIRCCNDRLLHELEKLSPLVVVVLGLRGYIALGGSADKRMSDIEGVHLIVNKKFDAFVTYHPAAIIHSGLGTSKSDLIRSKMMVTINTAISQTQDKQLVLL